MQLADGHAILSALIRAIEFDKCGHLSDQMTDTKGCPIAMALILALESTCDETAAAVVSDGVDVLSNVVASQVELHAKYRGVVPEIASRAHIENILPVIREALAIAKCDLSELDAIAVANRPGLIGSLLISVTAAKTLAWSTGKPLIAVDHVQAHLYSVALKNSAEINQKDDADSASSLPHSKSAFPAIGLVCSGGHTSLYLLNSFTDLRLIGATIDDAVGEAYDKVATILGLGYPGGPIIDALAPAGDPSAVRFPRTMLSPDSLDFSFSGLKTAVLYHVHGIPARGETKEQRHAHARESVAGLSQQELADIAASFQAACVDILIKKIQRAARKYNAKSIIIGGGVSANTGLRQAAPSLKVPVQFPSMQYCTDNAAMSAGVAFLYYQQDQFSPLDLDAIPQSAIRAK